MEIAHFLQHVTNVTQNMLTFNNRPHGPSLPLPSGR